MRDVHIRHEVEPYVGFVPSLFLCAVGTGLAILFAGNLPLAPEHVGTLIVPASLATLLSGFLVLTTRRKAISQVVGYLILENGIFIFGLLLIEAMPFLVEVGVLLDLFVGIFVMGIIINHIRQEFSSLDTRPPLGAEGLTGGGKSGDRPRPPPARRPPSWRRSSPRRRSGRSSSRSAALLHLAPPRRDPRRRRQLRSRRLAQARPARHRHPRDGERPLPPRRLLRAGVPRAAPRPRQPGLLRGASSSSSAMTSLLALAQHLGLLWVAIEATTLATAPLIYFNRDRPVARGDLEVPDDRLGRHRPRAPRLALPRLLRLPRRRRAVAPLRGPPRAGRGSLSRPWLRAAFVLLLVGYGTKMGLAPMHTWKPDAYGEAPGARRRAPRRRDDELRLPRPPARLPRRERGGRGGLRPRAPRLHGARSRWRSRPSSSCGSATSSGCSPTRASSTWASSSSASASAGSASSARSSTSINNGLTKGVLFLSAGNIHRAYGSKSTDEVSGRHLAPPDLGEPLPRRLLRDHRLAAVRPVRQRVHDPERAPSAAGTPSPGRSSSSSSASSSSAWARPSSPPSRGGPGPPRRGHRTGTTWPGPLPILVAAGARPPPRPLPSRAAREPPREGRRRAWRRCRDATGVFTRTRNGGRAPARDGPRLAVRRRSAARSSASSPRAAGSSPSSPRRSRARPPRSGRSSPTTAPGRSPSARTRPRRTTASRR